MGRDEKDRPFRPGLCRRSDRIGAIARVCRFGVVLRKSGLNASRLMNQSRGFAWVIKGPDNEIRLRSSDDSDGCASTHRRSASTIFVKRGWHSRPGRPAKVRG